MGEVYTYCEESDINKVIDAFLKCPHEGIREYLLDDEFVLSVKNKIVEIANDRCSERQLVYYKKLCERYDLPVKGTANRKKLGKRIDTILKTRGASQDLKGGE